MHPLKNAWTCVYLFFTYYSCIFDFIETIRRKKYYKIQKIKNRSNCISFTKQYIVM